MKNTKWRRLTKLVSIILISSFIFINYSFAVDREVHAISFGPVQLGESRIPINLKDFPIKTTIPADKVQLRLLEDSTQWVRNDFNLLIPRARLAITYSSQSTSVSLNYSKNNIIPEQTPLGHYTEIFISLFDSEKIGLYENGKLIGEIWAESIPPQDKSSTSLIDYSCSPYSVQAKGIEGDYLSVGCRLERVGTPGKEKPRLEITWSSTNLRLLNDAPPPYVVVLSHGGEASIKVKNRQGIVKTISFSASLPKRLHRFRVGLGLGPYTFDIKEENKRTNTVTGSMMLYSNLMLSSSTSLRLFDAIVAQKGIFNNFGSYFAYDMANLFDNRIQIVPLIGFQHLYFKYDQQSSSKNHIIYPQGFEINYRHAFGMENYLLGYGMFLSTSREYDYKNLWLRFGKKVFAELNYIEWGKKEREAKMWGFSLGFPLMQML